MKNLSVAALFLFSLASVFSAARVEAQNTPSIEARASRPAPLPPGKGDDDKDDEEDEEEYQVLGSLELVDPSLQDDVLRLQVAARLR